MAGWSRNPGIWWYLQLHRAAIIASGWPQHPLFLLKCHVQGVCAMDRLQGQRLPRAQITTTGWTVNSVIWRYLQLHRMAIIAPDYVSISLFCNRFGRLSLCF